VSQDAESRHQEVLWMLSDQAEEYRRNLEQSMELTNDFLALRWGELEYWRTDGKSRRRSDIIKVRDEVAHGGRPSHDRQLNGRNAGRYLRLCWMLQRSIRRYYFPSKASCERRTAAHPSNPQHYLLCEEVGWMEVFRSPGGPRLKKSQQT
jgi:hypothetical protein